jgi:hypothetical protein
VGRCQLLLQVLGQLQRAAPPHTTEGTTTSIRMIDDNAARGVGVGGAVVAIVVGWWTTAAKAPAAWIVHLG